MSRKKWYFGTNTKMYKGIADTRGFLQELKELVRDIPKEEAEIFVIPSYTSLPAGREVLKDSEIRLGAQNMCWEEQGQFTGEISPLMLAELGIDLVEIGHSERRHIFGETDEMEARKVAAAVKHGLTPLLCVGETLEEKESGISDERLRIQIKKGFQKVDKKSVPSLMVAYEPVWAIGEKGICASPEYVNARHAAMREVLFRLFGEGGQEIPILYGGSVNQENAVPLMHQRMVDGLFIGRSAWEAKSFDKIIRMALAEKKGKDND